MNANNHRRRRPLRRLAAVMVAGALAIGSQIALVTVTSAAPRTVCIVSAGVTFSVRNTVVTGTAGTDSIDCRGARKGLTIYGMGGGDDIWGTKAADVIWGDHSSTPTGSCAAPSSLVSIQAGAGNDTVHGSVCGATVDGGPGNDLIVSEGGWVSFQGRDGDDILDARNATLIDGQIGPMQSFGGAGNDTIRAGNPGLGAYGDEGNDHLVGGSGADRLEGGLGDDSLEGNGGNDVVIGDDGIDQLMGGDGDDVLHDGSPESDTFDGGNNDTTSAPLPRPGPGISGAWGDTCSDADGYGTAPGDPDGSGTTGSISGDQNDTIAGCEYLVVG